MRREFGCINNHRDNVGLTLPRAKDALHNPLLSVLQVGNFRMVQFVLRIDTYDGFLHHR